MRMKWRLWTQGVVERRMEPVRPLLASWEKSTHPAQIRLRAYLEQVTEALTPLPEGSPLFFHMDIDVENPDRLLRHYDLENYLTPLFGSRWLPSRRFVFVSARKAVGGGSRIICGPAKPLAADDADAWSHFSLNAGSGSAYRSWKENICNALAASHPPPVLRGPASVRLAWRCSASRNWTALWKPTGDAMGPVLGVSDPRHPFNPEDDRIANLELHLNADDSLGHDVVVGIWWRAA